MRLTPRPAFLGPAFLAPPFLAHAFPAPAFLAPAAMLAAFAFTATADSPKLRLQDADISAHGGRLSIVRLPVDIGGKTVYRDVTVDFRADANGDIFINSAVKPVVTSGGSGGPSATYPVPAQPLIVSKPSPPPVAQNFRAGTYRAGDGGTYHLQSLGAPYFGGLPSWRLSVLGSSGHVLDSATWSDGPIDQQPLHRRLRNAGISSQAFSWGTVEGGEGVGFDSNALIGVTGVGSTLTIYSFHKGCCTDTAEATHVISFDLIAAD